MEDELRKSDKRFREFVENLPQTVFEIDNEGIITFVNKNVYASFGYTENDFKNKISIFQLVHHDYHAKIEKMVL